MKEQRKNYLWGLSPGNIITMVLIISSVIGSAAIAQYRISENANKIEDMQKEKRTQKEKITVLSSDMAVVKAVVLRIEKRMDRRR